MTTQIEKTSSYAKFINENIDELIEMKQRCTENEFVYLHTDGRLLKGSHDKHGFSMIENFGGCYGSGSKKEQVSDLKNMIRLYEQHLDSEKELNGYPK